MTSRRKMTRVRTLSPWSGASVRQSFISRRSRRYARHNVAALQAVDEGGNAVHPLHSRWLARQGWLLEVHARQACFHQRADVPVIGACRAGLHSAVMLAERQQGFLVGEAFQ